jgi:hypothetical protein
MYQHPMSLKHSLAGAGAHRCPRLPTRREIATQRRREHLWAWASVLLLVLCWEASLRLDEKVPVPRVRLAHAADTEFHELRGRSEER